MSQLIASNKYKSIEFYIDNGFTLFPLNGKVPPKNCHWRETTFNPFFECVNNFGVQLSASDLVIDVDPRNGGQESFNKLLLTTPLKPTLTVLTGSGGTHYYFKKPFDIKIRKNLKEFKGIDFISEGGYVVGAGSLHPETEKEYSLVPSIIEAVPVELLELLQKQDIILKTGVKDYVDDEQTKQRYIDYLSTADAAIEGQGGDRLTFAVAAVGRDFGLPPSTTLHLLDTYYNEKCRPHWTIEELTIKVNNVYKYADGSIGSKSPSIAFPKERQTTALWTEEQDKYFHRTDGGKIKLDKHNISLMFAPTFPLEGLLAMDLFSLNLIFTRKAPWHKTDDVKTWSDTEATICSHWLSTNYKLEPSKDLMHESAVVAGYQYQFHPVKQYFESIQWDGHKRVHNWMPSFLGTVDDQYTRAVGLKTLVACVKRIYEPGCKFDYITVLEGRQDTGKSTAWKILASDPWFGDTPIDISKEWSIMKTFGKLMYEWAEMETYRKSNTQAMKAFLSSSTDTVRLPYNRTVQPIPRQGIFVGTFNPESDRDIGWLHDTTGNRRYWIVETSVNGDIRNDKLAAVRDQLWAEALVLYRAGTPIYFEDMVISKLAQVEQNKRLGRDPWYHPIAIWVNAPHTVDRLVLTGDEIFCDCIGGNLERYKRPEMSRIARVMSELNWDKGVYYDKRKNESIRGYRRPMIE